MLVTLPCHVDVTDTADQTQGVEHDVLPRLDLDGR